MRVGGVTLDTEKNRKGLDFNPVDYVFLLYPNKQALKVKKKLGTRFGLNSVSKVKKSSAYVQRKVLGVKG